MAAVHAVLADEGDLDPGAPLAAVGTPLLHPLFPMRRPPFLPPESLVLLTRRRDAVRGASDPRGGP